ncbi:retrovirus-related pol polyprotein from transposon TNT 1-94 [Tanacetum coccineum]
MFRMNKSIINSLKRLQGTTLKPQYLSLNHLVPEVPQSQDTNNASTSSYPVAQNRWSRDQHIELVNIIGDPSKGMLSRSMDAKLTSASASEYLFADFLSKIEPKKLSEALKHPGWASNGYSGTRKINIELLPRTKQDWLLKVIVRKKELTMMKLLHHAFMNGKLKEEVYVKQPPRFESSEFSNYVCKLDKALYGLKRAPKAWYETLYTFLIQNKFVRGIIDNTLFIYRSKGEVLMVQVYMDDIIFGSTSYRICKQFEKLMTKKFEISMMGELTYFLGLQIKQGDKGISIYQEQYTWNLLKKYEISDSSSMKTLMVPPNNLGPDLAGQSKRITSHWCEKNLQVLERQKKHLRKFWCTTIAYDLDFKTFVEATGLDYNQGTYVSHSSPEDVKAELARIATDDVLINRTPVLKTAFPVAWRILFTFVIQGLEASRSLPQKKKKALTKKTTPQATETPPTKMVPIEDSDKTQSVSSGQTAHPQDTKRNIQLAVKGSYSPLDEGTRKSQPLPKGKMTDPKDLGGNKHPVDMGLPAMVPDKSIGTDAKYQMDQTQSTRFEVSVPDQHQSKTSFEMERGTLIFQPSSINCMLLHSKLYGDDEKKPSVSQTLLKESSTEFPLKSLVTRTSILRLILKNNLNPVKDRVSHDAIRDSQKLMMPPQSHEDTEDALNNYEKEAVDKEFIKFIKLLFPRNLLICTYTEREKDDMVTKEAVMKKPTKEPEVKNVEEVPARASRAISISIVKPLMRLGPELGMMRSPSTIKLTDTILEPDKGKGIFTDNTESLKKLVKATTVVHPDLDEADQVPYEIHGKLYHLTNDEIQDHLDKEEKIKKVTEEAKLLEMSKPELIKVVQEEATKAGVDPKILASAKGGQEFKKIQDAEIKVLNREHSQKIKKAKELRKKRRDQYMWTTTSRLKPKPITDVKIHPNTKPVVITGYRGTNRRNFEVHNPFKFGEFGLTKLDELGPIIHKKKNKIVGELMTSLGKRYDILKKISKKLRIQSTLPAPVQATSQPSGKKRKNQELEPEIRILRLKCNRSLPKGVPFVNNMEIEELEYGMFFINVFGDEAFQRMNDIHKVNTETMLTYLVMASNISTPENQRFCLKLRKLIGNHTDKDKLKSKKTGRKDKATQEEAKKKADQEAVIKEAAEQEAKAAEEEAKKKHEEEVAKAKSNEEVVKKAEKATKKAVKGKSVAETEDNEEDVNETEDVDQVLNNISTIPFLNTSTRSKTKEADKEEIERLAQEEAKRKAAEIEEKRSSKRKHNAEDVESKEIGNKGSKRQKIVYKGKRKQTGMCKQTNIQESPKRFTRGDAKKTRCKNKEANKKQEQEGTSKFKREKIKKAEEKELESKEEDVFYEGTKSENEGLLVAKAKKLEKMKMNTEASSSKAKNSRKKEAEEEKYIESDEEEVVKKVVKGKKEKGAKAEKSTKTVTYPTCSTRSSPKALYKEMAGLSNERKKCL